MKLENLARGYVPAPAAAPAGTAWPVRNPHLLRTLAVGSMYLGICVMQLLPLVNLIESPRQQLLTLGPGAVVVTGGLALCLCLIGRWALGRRLGHGERLSPVLVIGTLLLFACQAAILFLIDPPLGLLGLKFSVIASPMAFTPGMHARHVVLMNFALAVSSVAIDISQSPTLALLNVLNVSLTCWSGWSAGWSIAALTQLLRSQQARQELAIAEERLRIARDLHDILGRTLTTISIKSTLAAELIRRELHETAAAEIAEIRALAEEASSSMRNVVRGQLTSSWPEETAGARALLASAGIACRFTGAQPPAGQAQPLARVLREAVTNVLRHSAATTVEIEVVADDAGTTLTISNDLPNPPGDPGTGLEAMRDRLAPLGGTIEARHLPDRFTLEAHLPAQEQE